MINYNTVTRIFGITNNTTGYSAVCGHSSLIET